MSKSFAKYTIFLFSLLTAQISVAHEYPTTVPDEPSWGSRWKVAGQPYVYIALDYVASDKCSTQSSYSAPQSVQDWIATGTPGTQNWYGIRDQNGVPTANCVGVTVQCGISDHWDNNTCVPRAEVCDSLHMLDIRLENGFEVAYCISSPQSCPSGQVWDSATDQCVTDVPLDDCTSPQVNDPLTGQCIDPPPPECPAGEIYNALWGECHVPCVNPEHEWTPLSGGECSDPNPYNCPDGTFPREVDPDGTGGVTFTMCISVNDIDTDIDEIIPPELNDLPDCGHPDNVAGYLGDTPVCADELGACDSSGGSVTKDSLGVVRCTPDQADDGLPSCSSGQTITYNSASQAFTCKNISDQPDTIPTSTPDEPDADNDGIPDKDDSDMDGDGISNSLDADTDGDGIPNADDPTPNGSSGDGDGTGGGENSLTGGGNCEDKPDCKGDPIECAIVWQTWKTRCAAEQIVEELPDDQVDPDNYIAWSDEEQRVDDAYDAFEQELEITSDQQTLAETDSLKSSILSALPSIPGCTDLVMSFAKGDITVSCSRMASIRDVIGWAFYVLTAYMLFQIAITPIESKV